MATRKPKLQKPALEASWPFAVTANVAYRRTVFDRIGLFDPRMESAEDKDFSHRFNKESNLQLRYCPTAVVLHRHRATARALFDQHVGWGRGAGLLHAKYGLRWGVRDELGKYGELVGASARLASTTMRSAWPGANGAARDDRDHAYYEVVRRVAHRRAALQWMLRRRALRRMFGDRGSA